MTFQNLQDQVFNGLKMVKLIGKGSFGVVYEAESLNNSSRYAVKIQQSNTLNPQLHFEFDVYSYIQKVRKSNQIQENFIPKIYGLFSTKKYTFLVLQLLGKNLDQIFREQKKKVNKQKFLLYGEQIIQILKFLHECQIVYRDIKPQNFLFGIEESINKLYVIDFGLSRKLSNKNESSKKRTTKSLIGTARYASINSHLGKDVTKHDDMESFTYLLIYFLKGRLSWQGLKTKHSKQKHQPILKLKKHIQASQLCQGLPQGMIKLFNIVKNSEVYESVDYNNLIKCLKQSALELHEQKNELFPMDSLMKICNQQAVNEVQCQHPAIKDVSNKSHSQYDTESELLSKKSQMKRKKKPLLKRQFIIRQNQIEDEICESSQSQNDNQSNSKFMLP